MGRGREQQAPVVAALHAGRHPRLADRVLAQQAACADVQRLHSAPRRHLHRIARSAAVVGALQPLWARVPRHEACRDDCSSHGRARACTTASTR